MIEMGKQYRTRDGREVRIYAVDGLVGCTEVHGAINQRGAWVISTWNPDGSTFGPTVNDPRDLIEVKPTITRTEWVVRYNDAVYAEEKSRDVLGVIFANREAAEKFMLSRSVRESVAAITGPHEVTFTEGEGL